jgi:hypothetical protein
MKTQTIYKIRLEGHQYWCLSTNEWLKPSMVKEMLNQGFVFEIVE